MNSFDKDFIQYSDEKVKDETKHLALYFIIHIALYIVLLFFLIFFAWYTVFISTHKFYGVKGVSMMSTLNSQISEEQLLHNVSEAQNLSYDAVYVDKLTKPILFDIVVVEKNSNDSVIKRVMALQGDYITIAKGTNELGEERFYCYRIPSGSALQEFDDESAKLIENGENGYSLYAPDTLWGHNSIGMYQSFEVDVDGEKKTNDYEINFFKTFLESYGDENSPYNFYKSANGLIYVQVPENKIFYMGDNRAYSTDCRERGFSDVGSVVGRAEFIVYDYNFGNRLWEVVKFYFSEMEKFFAR